MDCLYNRGGDAPVEEISVDTLPPTHDKGIRRGQVLQEAGVDLEATVTRVEVQVLRGDVSTAPSSDGKEETSPTAATGSYQVMRRQGPSDCGLG